MNFPSTIYKNSTIGNNSIGIDLCSIERIHSISKKFGDIFVKKICTQNEINDLKKLVQYKRIRRLASIFASKEALSKVLGTGIFSKTFSFHDAEIYYNKAGQPIMSINPIIPLTHITMSVTYEHHFVIAVVFGEFIIDNKNNEK